MDGNQPSKQSALSCRICLKPFSSPEELALHERMHLEQMVYAGSLRHPYDRPLYNSEASHSGTLESFHELVQPLRSAMASVDMRSRIDPGSVSSPSSVDSRSSLQQDVRAVNSNQTDARSMMPSSPADARNLVAASPGDMRNIVNSSPADPRNMVPSSPADPRNFTASSPADPRNMIPSSAVDGRNLVAHSPVGEQRKLVASSPIEQRNIMSPSPSDTRLINPHQDARNYVQPSGNDTRNMQHANVVEQQRAISSPIDHRNFVPSSPADQRLTTNTGQYDQRAGEASRPHVTTSQTEDRDADQRSRIQSIVADIRTLESRNLLEQRSFVPPSSQMHRRDESHGFTAVTRSLSNEQSLATGALTSMPGDCRTMSLDTHLPTNSQPYSTTSYLDSLTRDLYPHELSIKQPSSHIQPQVNTPADALVDNRHPALPKLDGQLFSKHESYYNPSKTDYSQCKDKVVESHLAGYAAGMKLLSAQGSYFPPSYPAHAPPRYNMNKLPNYYNQAPPSDPSAKVEQILHHPKQTLHYGQPTHAAAPPHNHSQYQDAIPTPEQHGLRAQQQHHHHPQIASPIPVHGAVDQLRGYQGVTAAPNLAYSQFHKGSHSQTPIHAPVPSRAVPITHGYNLSADHAASNMDQSSPTPLTCYICASPFTNMAELSEHMKLHAQGMVAQSTMQPPSQQPAPNHNFGSSNVGQIVNSEKHAPSVASVEQANIIPPLTSGFKDKSIDDIKCSVCSKAFLKPVYLAEHMKSHAGVEYFECKVCKKKFKSKVKCSRHEVFHQKDASLIYCELCDDGFETKGIYLHHVQKVHTASSVQEPEVGTKKAVPLTGGSIDRSFESEESDIDKYVDCQICEAEIEHDALVSHLNTHPIFQCEKCDKIFIQKTEYVEHLMSVHRADLDNASSSKSSSNKTLLGHLLTQSKGFTKVGEKKKLPESVAKEANNQQIKKEVQKSAKAKDAKTKLNSSNTTQKKVNKTDNKSKGGIVYDDEKLEDSKQVEKVIAKAKFPCTQCESGFDEKSELIKHSKTHARDPTKIYCEVCDKSYHCLKEKGYYIYHMKYHSNADLVDVHPSVDVMCMLCRNHFRNNTLITHIKRDHAQYSCDICEWSYSTEKVLVSHMRRIHPKEHKHFVYVRKDFEDTVLEAKSPAINNTADGDNQSEDGNDQSKTFTCKICDKKYAKKQYLDRHMRTHSTAEDMQIACELCNKVFNCKGAYLFHIQHHPDVQTATIDVKTEADINNTIGSEKKSGSVEKESVGKSNAVEDITEKASRQTYTSVLNPLTGEFEQQLAEPSEDEHQVAEAEKEQDKKVKINVNSVVYCRICSKSLKRDGLLEHIVTHTLFSCNMCEFSFTKKQKLIDHRQALHLEEYIADEINLFKQIDTNGKGESGKTNDDSVTSEKDSSTKRKRGAKLLTCSLCNTELKQDKFIDHLRGHNKPVLHCQFCEREFSKLNALKVHEKSHERIAHSQTTLPHPKLCPVCNVKVESRESYVSHLRGHKRKGPFACKSCSEVFNSEKNLENHSKVYHDPQVKVYWKEDGEGLKFDLRTGRISEVVSDHLAEIREINELLKQNGRPEILQGQVARKGRERNASIGKGKPGFSGKEGTPGFSGKEGKAGFAGKEGKSGFAGKEIENAEDSQTSSDSEEITEEEKMKTDTSDDDYVPDESDGKVGKRRSTRIASQVDDEDEEEMSDEDSNEPEYTPKPTKRTRKLRTQDESDEETAEVSEEVSEEDKVSNRQRRRHVSKVKVNKAKFTVVKRGNKLLMKRTGNRVLRSTLNKDLKVNLRKSGLKRKHELKHSFGSKRLRRAASSPDKQANNRGESDNDTEASKLKCPVCNRLFTRNFSMRKHLELLHKGYTGTTTRRKEQPVKSPMAGKLRTRSKNLEKDDIKPVSTSTPKRSPKLVVQLSPIDADGKLQSYGRRSDKTVPEVAAAAPKSKGEKFQCEICKRVINSKWNFTLHMQAHKKDSKDNKVNGNKKDMKKKPTESKPFKCKECSESFKKKRDLYIHTKVHSTDGVADDSLHDVSTTDQESSISHTDQESGLNSHNTSMVASLSSNSFDHKKRNRSDADNGKRAADSDQTPRLAGRKRAVSDVDNSPVTPERKTSRKNNENCVNMGKNGDNSLSGNGVPALSRSHVKVSDSVAGSSHINSVSQGSQGYGRRNSEARNNNIDDSMKTDSSDIDDKKLVKLTPPIHKISAEKALLKWRAKVKDTLSSQLELHAAKKQEQLANPEIARVKEKLSTKSKSEVRNFECRICGVKFVAETVFRKHIEEHLYESPPYCSICDIYFMAIYPKKRLAEHNRKKHPVV